MAHRRSTCRAIYSPGLKILYDAIFLFINMQFTFTDIRDGLYTEYRVIRTVPLRGWIVRNDCCGFFRTNSKIVCQLDLSICWHFIYRHNKYIIIFMFTYCVHMSARTQVPIFSENESRFTFIFAYLSTV